jgi:hypothetical protein
LRRIADAPFLVCAAQCGDRRLAINALWGRAMLVNALLWLILVGLIVIIPCGCIMTRSSMKRPSSAPH